MDRLVPAGGSIDVPLAFEGTSVATVNVVASTPGVTASLAGTDLGGGSASGMTLLQTPSLPNPADGVLRVVNPGTAETTVTIVVQVETSRHLTITPSTLTVGKGDTLSFTVSVSEPSDSDGATAYLQDPTGTKTPITLTASGTGHWTGQITPTVGGSNQIYAQTTGERIRYDSVDFSVASGNVTIGSGFAEQLVDTDNDGLSNSLELTITVTAAKPGKYTLVAHLADATGTQFTLGGGKVTLVAGTQQVPIDFDGSVIYASGISGPYRLVNVHITDTTVSPALVEAAASDLGVTKPYDYHVFQH